MKLFGFRQRKRFRFCLPMLSVEVIDRLNVECCDDDDDEVAFVLSLIIDSSSFCQGFCDKAICWK